MPTTDNCVTIVPYFKPHTGKLAEFKGLCERFVAKTSTEPLCLYYGFSFDGNEAHCREGYLGGEGVLAHLENVSALLAEALQIADLLRLEIHGAEPELAKLRGPLAPHNPRFFVLECGFRRS